MNKKILLVDDEINILIGYQRILQKKYDIKLAENAPRALETIEKEGSTLFSVEMAVNINKYKWRDRASNILREIV